MGTDWQAHSLWIQSLAYDSCIVLAPVTPRWFVKPQISFT